MTETNPTVQDGLVVSLEYTLRRENGDVIDASQDQDPLEFLQGQGQIVPGLEKALYGMSIDEEKSVVVPPEQGYGQRLDHAFQMLPHDVFPEDMPLAPGLALHLRDNLGRVVQAHVAEVRPDGVLLDLNHPLAGMTLHFDVKVVDLRPATEAELSCGPCPSGGCASSCCG